MRFKQDLSRVRIININEAVSMMIVLLQMMYVSMRNDIEALSYFHKFHPSENRVKTGESAKQFDDLHGRVCV